MLCTGCLLHTSHFLTWGFSDVWMHVMLTDPRVALVRADSRNAGTLMSMELSLAIVGCELKDKCFPILSSGQAIKICISLRSPREFHRIELHFPILVAGSIMHHPIDLFSFPALVYSCFLLLLSKITSEI